MSTSMDECRSGCGCGSPLDEDTGRCVECGADSRQFQREYIKDFDGEWWHVICDVRDDGSMVVSSVTINDSAEPLIPEPRLVEYRRQEEHTDD